MPTPRFLEIMANSIIQAFEETVQRRGNDPAARFRDTDDKWVSRTWTQMDRARKILAAGLFELGLGAKERMNVLANTSYDWMLADLAIQTCGGETVPIYQSNLPAEVEYIVNNCGAVMMFAENQEQLDKILEQKDKLTNVRKVVTFDDAGDGAHGDFVIGMSKVLSMGEAKVAELEGQLKERTSGLTPDDVLTIIYTSGTTGHPKGVVLTHANMLYEVKATEDLGVVQKDDLQFLFLPMAHVFAKVLQCTWFGTGHEMAIDANIPRITENLGQVKPTVVASVPRIFEKVYAKVVGGGLEAPGLKGSLFKWALGLNDQYATLMLDNKPIPFGLDLQLNLAKKLVFSKINERLNEIFGGRIRFFVSGGAPLPKKMAYFFKNADILILEGYGLTETSAATCVNPPDGNRIGTVGKPLPGTEIKLASDGEIMIKGPGVMREYWKREDATKEVIQSDGWFATGDIGTIDEDGYLRITDRKKDIIVTAGGKNVAPQNIENLIKSKNPMISQVVVYGDKRKYLSALVSLDPDNAANFGKEKGVSGGYEAICNSSQAREAVQATLDSANGELAKYETIKKFKILEKDFEVGDELTASLKVKRKVVNKKYEDVLESFYDSKDKIE